MAPVRVWSESSPRRLARPKSVILGRPSAVRRMLAGLRSRWTIPWWWAAWMARARVRMVHAACVMSCGRPSICCGEAAAVDEFEAEVGQATGLADLVDLDDVGVLEAGDGLGLHVEPRQGDRGRRGRRPGPS